LKPSTTLRGTLPLIAVLTVLIAGAPLLYAANSGSDTWTVTIATYPENLPLIVDGIIYTPAPGQNGYKFHFANGSKHTVTLLKDTFYTSPGTRLVFSKWNNGEETQTLSFTATRDTSIIALYDREYYVEVASQYGTPEGAGWYREGSRAPLSIPSIVVLDNNTRAVFTGWTGGALPWSNDSNYVYVFSPISVRPEWRIEYKYSVIVPLKGNLTGWAPPGSRVQVEAPSTLTADNGRVRYVFSHWVSTGGLTVESAQNNPTRMLVTGPGSIVAVYKSEYLVTLTSGNHTVEKYVPAGGTFEYNPNPIISKGPNTRLVLVGWEYDNKTVSGAPVKITVNHPVNLTAIWRAQYKITVESPLVPVKGTGWYYEGSKILIKAPARVDTRLGVRLVFSHWEGDASGANNTLLLAASGPMHVKAVYNTDRTPLMMDASLAITLTFVGLGIVYLYSTGRIGLRRSA